ncbi:hypothetical protein HRI_000254600 [Hibiscus trionum]|uniref:C2H2-type domain-containing protein n=1 Tax=Hibiscus trionum TaxID=183268 RepID=A0A9W7LIA4_HIBTR|nr:hypothetical protein HRI_000254600 [Hibiscus trionum]
MEQDRYLMWTKRRSDGLSCCYDSWEEQAFAEDAGGCIWPPRSYSCSFCGREFRSAQALGGHMNVHRRDRARLKQSPPTDPHQQNPFSPLGDEVCNFAYSPNPNSLPPSKENCPEQTSVPPLSSPMVQESHNKSPKSWSNLADDRYYHFSDLRADDGDKSPRILASECRVKAGCVQTTDLSSSLNLVVRETRPPTSGSKQDITVGCKRKRSDDHHTPTTLPLFLKPVSAEDDIDLELRLGRRPKVR